MSQHITVLLAAYNGASYIEEQIRSILVRPFRQTSF